MKELKELLLRYMNSWVERDKELFLASLADEIDIRECYGASYSTKREAAEWFTEWNNKGKVLSWEMTDSFYDPERKVLVASWKFHHEYPDPLPERFDGITVMKASKGKITMLHEYETKHERFYPYKK